MNSLTNIAMTAILFFACSLYIWFRVFPLFWRQIKDEFKKSESYPVFVLTLGRIKKEKHTLILFVLSLLYSFTSYWVFCGRGGVHVVFDGICYSIVAAYIFNVIVVVLPESKRTIGYARNVQHCVKWITILINNMITELKSEGTTINGALENIVKSGSMDKIKKTITLSPKDAKKMELIMPRLLSSLSNLRHDYTDFFTTEELQRFDNLSYYYEMGVFSDMKSPIPNNIFRILLKCILNSYRLNSTIAEKCNELLMK